MRVSLALILTIDSSWRTCRFRKLSLPKNENEAQVRTRPTALFPIRREPGRNPGSGLVFHILSPSAAARAALRATLPGRSRRTSGKPTTSRPRFPLAHLGSRAFGAAADSPLLVGGTSSSRPLSNHCTFPSFAVERTASAFSGVKGARASLGGCAALDPGPPTQSIQSANEKRSVILDTP